MSLVAALLVGSSAFAIENTKVSGDANLFYSTSDENSGTLFDKDTSAADVAINLNVTTDLVKNDTVAVSAGVGYTVLTTLGLENNLVSGVWGGAHGATTGTTASYLGAAPYNGVKVENADWVNEAWVAATAGKSTVKLGRMELDTPLAFTEKWTIEKNTFEAAVLINQDIPDTTLVGAFIGNGNGTETFGGGNPANTVATAGLATGAVVNENGQFATYGSDGAYAIGAINNSYKPLSVQAWYYDVIRVADAYWLQADLDASTLGAKGVTLGAQYTAITPAAGGDSTQAAALKVGYEMKDMFTASIAYSKVSDSGVLGHAGFNTATNEKTAQTKLYTETWWNYGNVTVKGAEAINLTVEGKAAGIDLGLYITSVDHLTSTTNTNGDVLEATITASKSYGPLDTTLAIINSDFENDSADNTTVQAYLTLNF
jgi:hypothetical protein